MTNHFRNVGAALFFGLALLVSLFTGLTLTVEFLIYETQSINSSPVLNYYLLYTFTFYKIILALVSLFILGEYNNLLLRISYNRNGWYNKLKVLSFFTIIEIFFGLLCTILILKNYLDIKTQNLRENLVKFVFVTSLTILTYICIYILHPDLWNLKLRSEIRGMRRIRHNFSSN